MRLNSSTPIVVLIGHCLTAETLDTAQLGYLKSALSSSAFDWKKLCAFAGEYWLLPYLHGSLKRANLLAIAPIDVQEELYAVRQLSEIRNQRIKTQLNQVIMVLNRRGIQPLLLKGASYLLQPVSPIQQIRMTSDIDILIPHDSIHAAIDALQADGYKFANYLPEGTDYHLDPLLKAEMPTRVELHEHPLAPNSSTLISKDNAWNNTQLINHDKLAYFIFTPEYRLVHQLAHAQIHSSDYFNARLDLRQLYDFHLMSTAYSYTMNWPIVENVISKKHKDIWINYILLSCFVFGTASPPSFSSSLEQRCRAKKLLAKLSEENLQFLLHHWLERIIRLPNRLTSVRWYLDKFRSMIIKP